MSRTIQSEPGGKYILQISWLYSIFLFNAHGQTPKGCRDRSLGLFLSHECRTGWKREQGE